MNNLHRKAVSTILLIVATISLSACSSLTKVRGVLTEGEAIDYQNNQTVKSLEVPPDLTQPNYDDSLDLPRISANNGSAVNSTGNKRYISPPSFDFSGANNNGAASSVINTSGRAVLRVNSDYSKSLVSIQENLKKIGFDVVSQSSGVITAKYTEDVVLVSDSKVSEFFKYIVVGDDRKRLIKFDAALETDFVYLVSVTDEKTGPMVRFARADGNKISDAAHTKIIGLLNTSFNG